MTIEIRPRETVILSREYRLLVDWYREVLGFEVKQEFTGANNYANLETASGIKIGIGVAAEVDITPGDATQNTVVQQVEVTDVRAFFEHVKAGGGQIVFGPSYNEADGFWFGAVADPEGNQIWVVDDNCP